MLGFETHEQSVSVLWTVWVKCVMKCSINHVLVCLTPKMTVKPGSPSEPINCALKGTIT